VKAMVLREVGGPVRLEEVPVPKIGPNDALVRVRATGVAMTDRYPMDVEQAGMAPQLMRLNVANLWDCLTGSGIHRRG